MKQLNNAFLQFLLFTVFGFQATAQQKVYYVGHSLVNINIPYQVWKIQDKANVPNYFMHHINIGASLKTNWNDTLWNQHPIWDFDLKKNIDRGSNHLRQLKTPYDFLVITEAVPLQNYPTDTVLKYLNNFINLAKTGNSAIKSFLYATWEGNSADGAKWRADLDVIKPIWENLADLSAQQTGGPVYIIPGNLAVMQLYDELQEGPIGSYTTISQFFEQDGIHLSPEGNYLIACLMSAVVYHTSPIGQDIIQAGSYTSDSCIRDDVARKRIQEIAMEVACDYARTGFTHAYCGDTTSTSKSMESVASVTIYPNPSTGIFSIESKNPIQSVIVSNLAGDICFESNKQIKLVDLSLFARGMYIVQYQSGNKTAYKKIILN